MKEYDAKRRATPHRKGYQKEYEATPRRKAYQKEQEVRPVIPINCSSLASIDLD